MNIRDLKYLLAVAEHENFGKAARECCVSQPTLSGQVKKLEDELGVAIFERNNRTVFPTPVGHQILDHARRVLTQVEQIKQIADHAKDPLSGRFVLGAFPTVASYVLPKCTEIITQALPDIQLILVEEKTETLLAMLRDGTVDAALLATPVKEECFDHYELFDDDFYLAVPSDHPLRMHQTIDQSMLAGQELLLLEEGHCLRDQALEVCFFNAAEEQHNVRATSLETLRQMVKAGTGITLMPECAVAQGEPGIHYIPFAEPVPFRTIGLFWRKTSTRMEVIERFTKAVDEALAMSHEAEMEETPPPNRRPLGWT